MGTTSDQWRLHPTNVGTTSDQWRLHLLTNVGTTSDQWRLHPTNGDDIRPKQRRLHPTNGDYIRPMYSTCVHTFVWRAERLCECASCDCATTMYDGSACTCWHMRTVHTPTVATSIWDQIIATQHRDCSIIGEGVPPTHPKTLENPASAGEADEEVC